MVRSTASGQPPVSARGVCGDCFEVELSGERELAPTEDESPAPISQEPMPGRRILPVRLGSFLPRSRSKIVFALVMGSYCIAVGSFMAAWTWVARLPRPPKAFYLRGDVPDVLGLLIFGPVIESLMLVAIFELLRRVRTPDWGQVVVSAVFISALHFGPWWPHAFIVLPSFLIQSASYLYWRRTSWKEAFWVLVCVHALSNLIPALNAVGRAMRHA